MTARLESTAVMQEVERRMESITRRADERSALRTLVIAAKVAIPCLHGSHGPHSIDARSRLEKAVERAEEVLR